MNQIVLSVVVGYAGPYVYRYCADKLTDIALNKTKNVVKKKVSAYMNNKPLEVEYELLDIGMDGMIINEPIIYVTSKGKDIIDQSWANLMDSSRPSSAFETIPNENLKEQNKIKKRKKEMLLDLD